MKLRTILFAGLLACISALPLNAQSGGQTGGGASTANVNSSPASVTAGHVAVYTGTAKQTQDGGPLTGATYSTTNTFTGATVSTTTFEMSGFGAAGSAAWGLTPRKTGTVLLGFSGNMRNNTAASYSCSFQIVWGTGTAPPANQAASGTVVSGSGIITGTTVINGAADQSALISGLAVGTAYWFDVQVESNVSSDQCQLQAIKPYAAEL